MLSRGRVSPNLYSLQISPRQTRLYRNGIPLYRTVLFHRHAPNVGGCSRRQTSSVSRRFILPALRKGKATHAHQLPVPESSPRAPTAHCQPQPPAARRRDSFVHTSIIVPRARSAPTLRATRSAASHTSHTPRRCSMLTAILSYHSLTALWPTAPPPAHHRLRATSELVQHGVTTPHV